MALRCLSRFIGSFLACLRLLRLAAKLNSIVWRQHCFRANQRIELPGADEPRGERLFLQARSIKMRGLASAVTSIKPHQFVDPLPERGKPFDAMAPETVHGVREEGEAFEKRECDDRLMEVELEMILRSPTAWFASRSRNARRSVASARPNNASRAPRPARNCRSRSASC